MVKTELLERLESIKAVFLEKYESIRINGEDCYLLKSGVVFRVVALGDEFNALVIEYSGDIEEYKKNNSEDGDLFFMDMEKEEMLRAMSKEIETNL